MKMVKQCNANNELVRAYCTYTNFKPNNNTFSMTLEISFFANSFLIRKQNAILIQH